MAEVATAASAASSTSVSLATSLKMHTSSIAPDTQTSRFIIKYKTGTAERGSTIAVQAKLDRLASALPARAHHSRRLVLGADVVTTERALNARDAKAFMRAIASDPNVEYVEPDTPMSIDSVPNDPDYSDQWGFFQLKTQDRLLWASARRMHGTLLQGRAYQSDLLTTV
jgi:serine protease